MDSATIDPDLREQVFDLLPLPALVVDRTGVVRMINHSMSHKMKQFSGKPVRTGGTGVGLAVCATVCERHGWTLDATGIPDVGAAFQIAGISQRPAGPRGAASGRSGAA